MLNIARWRVGDLPHDVGSHDGGSSTQNSSSGQSGQGSSSHGRSKNNFQDEESASNGRDDIDVFEFFSVLNLLSILCKAIVLAYNNLEKQQKSSSASVKKDGGLKTSTAGTGIMGPDLIVSFGELLHTLQPGTKSDLANAFLEGIFLLRLFCFSPLNLLSSLPCSL